MGRPRYLVGVLLHLSATQMKRISSLALWAVVALASVTLVGCRSSALVQPAVPAAQSVWNDVVVTYPADLRVSNWSTANRDPFGPGKQVGYGVMWRPSDATSKMTITLGSTTFLGSGTGEIKVDPGTYEVFFSTASGNNWEVVLKADGQEKGRVTMPTLPALGGAQTLSEELFTVYLDPQVSPSGSASASLVWRWGGRVGIFPIRI